MAQSLGAWVRIIKRAIPRLVRPQISRKKSEVAERNAAKVVPTTRRPCGGMPVPRSCSPLDNHAPPHLRMRASPILIAAPCRSMKTLAALLFALATFAHAELCIPASTAYGDPWERGAKIGRDGIADWKESAQKILWFGEIKTAGKLDASVVVRLPAGAKSKLRLTIADQTHDGVATGGAAPATVSFGSFTIAKPGYVRFELSSANPGGTANGDIDALVLDGPAAADAHFNTDPRRNAASVHLFYPVPKDAAIEWFYNEVTATGDPLHSYYMACGFARGYFGMQVNSATERRIIFSVWDAASGQSAKDRSTVAGENHTQLLGKGPGVVASVFGNEGTGGHSHLVVPWKTGEAQKFLLGAKADGTNTIYTAYWFHPGEKKWTLMAGFRAPKDGKLLRGLHSFSENFGGGNGHLQRKALYGPQWIRTVDGQWRELTEASFSHDGTGKTARLDRFMGVEGGRFFLAHGGFVPGFTKYGEKFTRPASKAPPAIHFAELPQPK